MRTVCAWCDGLIKDGPAEPLSHGICLDCLPSEFGYPIVSLDALERERLDELPYGVVRLDRNDRVIEYNRAESELAHRSRRSVIGKHFFEEVAPCTNVQEIAAWIAETRARGETAVKHLNFVFQFPFGRELVKLSLSYDGPSAHTTILVRSVGREVEPESGGAAAPAD